MICKIVSTCQEMGATEAERKHDRLEMHLLSFADHSESLPCTYSAYTVLHM